MVSQCNFSVYLQICFLDTALFSVVLVGDMKMWKSPGFFWFDGITSNRNDLQVPSVLLKSRLSPHQTIFETTDVNGVSTLNGTHRNTTNGCFFFNQEAHSASTAIISLSRGLALLGRIKSFRISAHFGGAINRQYSSIARNLVLIFNSLNPAGAEYRLQLHAVEYFHVQPNAILPRLAKLCAGGTVITLPQRVILGTSNIPSTVDSTHNH